MCVDYKLQVRHREREREIPEGEREREQETRLICKSCWFNYQFVWIWFGWCFLVQFLFHLPLSSWFHLQSKMLYYIGYMTNAMGTFELPGKACNPKLKSKLSSFPSFIIRSFWARTQNNAHNFSYLFPVFSVYTFIFSAYSPHVLSISLCVWVTWIQFIRLFSCTNTHINNHFFPSFIDVVNRVAYLNEIIIGSDPIQITIIYISIGIQSQNNAHFIYILYIVSIEL